jgi:hypothetical protein
LSTGAKGRCAKGIGTLPNLGALVCVLPAKPILRKRSRGFERLPSAVQSLPDGLLDVSRAYKTLRIVVCFRRGFSQVLTPIWLLHTERVRGTRTCDLLCFSCGSRDVRRYSPGQVSNRCQSFAPSSSRPLLHSCSLSSISERWRSMPCPSPG